MRHATAAAAVLALLLCACGSDVADESCSGSRAFAIEAIDADTLEGIPSALIALEPDGLSHASPAPVGAYVLGGQADTAGAFSLPLSCGTYGVHAFASHYRCASVQASNTGTLQVQLEALDPNAPVPQVLGAEFDAAAPAAGTMVTLTAVTRAVSLNAADQVAAVIAIEPSTNRALALMAVADAGDENSDGQTQTWQVAVRSASSAGTYSYSVVAATADCVASKISRVTLASH